MYMHRKKKIFKAASPIFLTITLFGCAVMYLEVSEIFISFIFILKTKLNFIFLLIHKIILYRWLQFFQYSIHTHA